MITGLGFDLVEIERIRLSLERFGFRFLDKLLHDTEKDALSSPLDFASPAVVAHIAGRFAAKEAGAKALGSGFANGVGLHDIRIRSLASGKPALSFHGGALRLAEALAVNAVHLSISHARATAGAVVILESPSAPPCSGESV